jgi:hypothetical protein
MRVMGVSERFACRVTGQNRTTQRHQPKAVTPTAFNFEHFSQQWAARLPD